MYVKVEPSGCCERKGLVQIRLCMYLDKGDYGYEKCHRLLPVGNPVYTGKMEKLMPLDETDFLHWYESLEKAEVDVPFHNHFIYVTPTATDKYILDIGETFLREAYALWEKGERITCSNPPVNFDLSASSSKKLACANKASSIGAIERKL